MTRAKFLQEKISWANGILSRPNARFPNGRMSHDAAREELIKAVEELEDLRLEKGRWYADGTFAGFAD